MGRADLGERQLTAPAEQSLILSVLGQSLFAQIGEERNVAAHHGLQAGALTGRRGRRLFPLELATRSDRASIFKSIAFNAAVWVRWRASDGDAHLWNTVSNEVSTRAELFRHPVLVLVRQTHPFSCLILTRF
jgi:hypothetical protein